MQLYCPSCRAAVAGSGRCPRCDGRLVAPGEAVAAGLARGHSAPPPLAAPTGAGRVAVGVVTALGVVVGLRDAALGVVLALAGPDAVADVAGVLTLALGFAGAVAGGAVAGAGRVNGALTGAAAGLVAGALLLSIAAHAAGRPAGAGDALALAGLTAAAAAAGFAGGRAWPAAGPAPVPVVRVRGSSVGRLATTAADDAVPTRTDWARVGLGAAVLVVGVAGAEAFRTAVKAGTRGGVYLGSPADAPLVTGLFAAAAVLAGGAAAGATTRAGARHGLLAGLAGAALVLGLIAAGNPAVASAVDGLAVVTDFEPGTGRALLAVTAATPLAAAAGGAFGSALLPALGRPRKRSRAGD